MWSSGKSIERRFIATPTPRSHSSGKNHVGLRGCLDSISPNQSYMILEDNIRVVTPDASPSSHCSRSTRPMRWEAPWRPSDCGSDDQHHGHEPSMAPTVWPLLVLPMPVTRWRPWRSFITAPTGSRSAMAVTRPSAAQWCSVRQPFLIVTQPNSVVLAVISPPTSQLGSVELRRVSPTTNGSALQTNLTGSIT